MKEQSYDIEHTAKVTGIALPVSFKQSVEVCSFIKNMYVNEAKKILERVIEKKMAVPFKRYKADLSHKKIVGPGRYPEKTSKVLVNLIDNAVANAQFKGLNTSKLFIKHIVANKSGKGLHYGRKPGRKMKRTNIEIIVEEKVGEK